MFTRFRIRRAHARFLEASRNLRDDDEYWRQAGPWRRGCVSILLPSPLALHEDGIGLARALEWLEQNRTTVPVSEALLRRYHQFVRGGSGTYRTKAMTIRGSSVSLPPPDRVPLLVKQWSTEIEASQRLLDQTPDPEKALDLAVDVHYRIGMIHPFSDGNGRVARLAMNHLLRRYGCGYVIYPRLHEESPLWKALIAANQGSLTELRRLARESRHRI